jgi:hypothetical protein
MDTVILFRPVGSAELRLMSEAGSKACWIPAVELTTFNENIVGLIEVVQEFGAGSTER